MKNAGIVLVALWGVVMSGSAVFSNEFGAGRAKVRVVVVLLAPLAVPLADIVVELKPEPLTNSDRFSTTNKKGEAIFKRVPPGNYFVIVNDPRYEEKLYEHVLVREGVSVTYYYRLTPVPAKKTEQTRPHPLVKPKEASEDAIGLTFSPKFIPPRPVRGVFASTLTSLHYQHYSSRISQVYAMA